jgi:hypothetical protein
VIHLGVPTSRLYGALIETENRMIEVKTVKLSDMSPRQDNPRKIDDKNMSALDKSIEQFGLVQPIVWNSQTGNIVGGHQRYKILRSNGVETTEAVVVNLTPDREKALCAALNDPHNEGEWTPAALEILESIEQNTSELFEALHFGDLYNSLVTTTGEIDPPNPEDKPSIGDDDAWTLGRHSINVLKGRPIPDVFISDYATYLERGGGVPALIFAESKQVCAACVGGGSLSVWHEDKKYGFIVKHAYAYDSVIRAASPDKAVDEIISNIPEKTISGSLFILLPCEKHDKTATVYTTDTTRAYQTISRWVKMTGQSPIRQDGVSWEEYTQ